MKLKSIVSLVFCIGVVLNLHGQILPAAFGVSTPSRPVANPIITSGLLLHLDAGNTSSYPGSGTTWTDLSGNSNHGTLFNGPTYSSANGGSIVFDGVNDYVKVVSSVIPNSGSFTVSTWAKIPPDRFTEMINTRNSTDYTGFLLTSRDSKIRVQINNPGVQQFEPNATGIIQDNKWHLITIVVDVSINQMKWYVDTNLVNTLSFVSGSLQGQSYFSIGWDYAWTGAGTQAYFLGSIATVSVYSRAFTATEVLENYNDLRPRFGDVTNPTTGKIWMDRNLGATQVATSSTDSNAYGDLYQWGRGADGHQLRTSSTTSTQSSTDVPGNANYILNNISPYDWRSTKNDNLWQGVSGVNNPCPSGYRLPTIAEWSSERGTWSSDNAAGAFASPLKLTMAGVRQFSSNSISTGKGVYWSSSVSGNNSTYIEFVTGSATTFSIYRTYGMSVRCIKD